MQKYPMYTERYMDEEERQILVAVKDGKYKTRSDLEKLDYEEIPGLMADWSMLVLSGYCGETAEGALLLTQAGMAAASASALTDDSA